MTRDADLITPTNLRQAGLAVKAQIVGTGISMTKLAKAAGVHKTTISNCLIGRNRSFLTQNRICSAFVLLSGKQVSLENFWGELIAPRRKS